jgi:hypothetical protein
MQLLNLSFAILIIKMALCILPGVLGIYFLVSSEETKRELRNTFCSKLFGVSNAISYPKFERSMQVFGALLLLFSLAASWFLLLRGMF